MNKVLQNAAGATVSDEAELPVHILVVEDEPDINLLMTVVLTRAGYRVDNAKDGVAGLEALRTTGYDLLITDNNMPSVTGLELIKIVRSEGILLPVILTSGLMPTDEVNQNPWLQIAAVLAKPFTTDALLGVVRNVLHARHAVPTEIPFPMTTEVVYDLDASPTQKPSPPAS